MCKSSATLSSSAMASAKVAAPRELPSDTQIERHRCRFSVSGKGCAELLLELDEIPCCVLTRVLAVDIMFIFALSSTLCTRGCGGVCVHEVLCVVLVVRVCVCVCGVFCVCGVVRGVCGVLWWCCRGVVWCVCVVWWWCGGVVCGCCVWVLCGGVVYFVCGVEWCVCLFFSFFSQLSFLSSGTLSFFPLFLSFFSLLFSLLSSLPLSLLSSLLATKHCVKNRSTNTASNFEAS